MKKIFCSLVIAMAITGVVSAQITGDKFDLDAVPTTSTEARYSAGRFSSDVDNYIGVNDYDADIGTFVFLGGFPSDSTVDATADPGYELSLGVGKTLGASYLGLYFGGNLVNASGTDDGQEKATRTATATWNTNIALLFGNASLGAFRLDLILNATDTSTTYDGKKASSTGGSTTTALSWGKSLNDNLAAHAAMGIVWPNTTGTNLDELNGATKNKSRTGGGMAVSGGVDMGDLSADLTLQFGFSDKTVVGDDKTTTKAPFWTFIDLAYGKNVDLTEKFSIGFKPNATIGLRIWNPDVKSDLAADTDAPAETTFEVLAGFDLGIKYKLKESFTLYTGASLQIFDWYVWGISGGDAKAGGGGWEFNGIEFDTTKWANQSNLGFGLVYAPNANLSVGAGLNTLLDKFIQIDLQKMQVTTNNPFADSSNFVTAIGSFFGGMTFDLTVSYKL
jgi:hypothetical protein